MEEQRLIFEDMNDALAEVVRCIGGAKAVGQRMRPELPPDQAGNWVRDCCNPNRRERFDPDQVLLLLRWGNEGNAHGAMRFIGQQANYEIRPIKAVDQANILIERAEVLARESRAVAVALERLARAPIASVKTS